MTTYIRDLFDLPERVHGGDFVLKLTEGVADPQGTLASYVVTPQLASCFDAVLDLIKGAVDSRSSKAAYLHGSFGSGKSHFMAVLHLLLAQHPGARAKEGLEAVVSSHNPWLEGKRFLLVPYHMIGKPSLEAAVLGGYAERVRSLHPEAPVPAVYRAEGLLRDAREMRASLGDEAFFARLDQGAAGSGGGSAEGGWGELEAGWDAAGFETALAAPPGSEERGRLISALVGGLFTSYRDVVRDAEEAFISLDDGLAVVSRHARDLGYDALVLFLDELILWLATHAADQRFLNREGPKVSKLVEAQSADRPIPIVSFVARQRDLRDLVGDNITGAEQLGFADVLRWWEARFDTITLEDRNLPEIAARRVLVPKSEAARQRLDAAWRETESLRREVLDVLLTARYDRGTFRKIYPFSPALMETLVAVSSVLQRERTALKLMLQLLVDQRDTLELGQIVPVGDLFAVIAEGDEPFTEGMRVHFDNAQRLYRRKLLPMLEKEHGLTRAEAAALPADDPRGRAFRADDRLLATLLLAALVPQVEALKDLDAGRLAALNHGSITAPIPGRERQEVLRRLRGWASQVGEIKLGDGPDPVVALQLTGVDTEAILANAQAIDNPGNRRRKIRELLFAELGIEDRDEMFLHHEMSWRGTSRSFQVIFGNVREMAGESLAARGGQRKVILDFPFDEPGHTPADDLARLESFAASEKPCRTLVWLPAFLSLAAQKDLGTLVRLDDILKSHDTFRRHASHLSAFDQAQARGLLENQRSQLHHRLIGYLEGAYGVVRPVPGSLDEAHAPETPFRSLDPSFSPQAPAGAGLRQAFEHLLAQMLESQYPAHPQFGAEIRPAALKKVLTEVERAAQSPDGRIGVEASLRALMHQIAVPLKLGEMGETHFVLGRHWYDHFNRKVEGEVTVGKLRQAMEEPVPMGLPEKAQNLVILLYADQASRRFVLHGGPAHPSLDSLPDELELREQVLPEPEVWEAALERAGKLFGLAVSPLRNAGNAAGLAEKLGEKARPKLEDCQALCDRLESVCAEQGIDLAGCRRHETARAVFTLVRGLVQVEGVARLEVLASAPVATSLDAMGQSTEKAAAMRQALERTRWKLFEADASLTGDKLEAARTLRAGVVEALTHDEYALALAPRLEKLEGDAIRLLVEPPKTREEPAAGGVREKSRGEEEIVTDGSVQGAPTPQAREILRELLAKLEADASLVLDLRFKLYRLKGKP